MAPIRKTTEFYINESNKVWNNFYNYQKTIYVASNKKIIITCPKHGDFSVLASNHLRGYGCSKCGEDSKILKIREKKSSEYFNKVKIIHGDFYIYNKSEYIHSEKNFIVTCPNHGDFSITPANHLSGSGCKECYLDKRRNNKENWVTETIEKYGKRTYDYENSVYISSRDLINIYCKSLDNDGNEHGEFYQNANNHKSQGKGCPKCAQIYGKYESEIVEYIKSLGISNIILNDRKILNGKELDIYIPELNISIEFNGLYWHSDVMKSDNYHVEKTNKCLELGIQLIHIFEDEWVYKQEIVKSRLRYILGKTTNIGYARKCFVKEIDSSIAKPFLENNHIQGFVSGSVYLGLYYPSEGKDYLLSVMTFGGLRKNTGNIPKENSYELLRFCNAKNYTVVGGANKLLKYFEVYYKPKFLLSYADRRWSVGSIYNVLNFVLSHISPPNYFYIKAQTRLNRWNYRKDLLIKNYGCSINDTERNFTKMNLGLNRIYDAGALVFHKLYK